MEELVAVPEHVHSEEMQDIIGKPPMWIYRWGISFILVVVLIGIWISAFVSYPETVRTKIKIHAITSPFAICYNDSVQLVKLYVQTGQLVKKGQHLADIKNARSITAVTSPQNGRLIYAGVIHESEQMIPKQPVFYISSPSESFYGEMHIPQSSMDKVKPGQTVLVSLKDYSGSESMLTGTVKYITDDPSKGEISIAEVEFNIIKKQEGAFLIKNGLITDAAIITANVTLFHRLISGMMMKSKNK